MTGPERRDANVDSDTDVPSECSRQDARSVTQQGASNAHAVSGGEHPDAPLDVPSDGTLQVEDESDPPTPRFLQDETAWKRWKWIPYPVRRTMRAVRKWSEGPPNAQPYRIKPFFPQIQEYPLRLVSKFLPAAKRRFWTLFFFFSIWLITFVLVKRQGNITTEIAGWGQPQPVGCGATYWGSGNACGVDGNDCRPFEGSGYAFRCPAKCGEYQVLNPRAVGDQEVIYRPMVVGGPSNDVNPEEAVYRGDSFLCSAAVHAGIVSNAKGGCGVVKLVGRGQNYLSTQRHGITSVSFDSYFPLSFQFIPDISCTSQDSRWSLLAISVVFTTVLSIFTASPALFFFPTFVGVFWTVGMATDPPSYTSVAAMFSNVIGKFLPAMFCSWVMYEKMGVRRTLTGLTAQVEKTVLWLGACWVGALSNYTFDFIPIQRLNAHDLSQQPGAKAALSIIIIVLVVIVVTQVWFFRQEARLLTYLKLYAIFLFGIIIALVLPGLNLRIHHYIIALLLLPGTSMQMRPSLLYQGLLIGLFINGVARWGFDSVLQTSAALQGDAQKNSPLPVIHDPVIDLSTLPGVQSNITFTWDLPALTQYDGISVLVNDVERFRSYFADVDTKDQFVWQRNTTLELPEYFRFALMDGSDSGDYTKAGIWTADGQWVDMKPGASKVKIRSLGEERLRRR